MTAVRLAGLEHSCRCVREELDGARDLTLVHGPPYPRQTLTRAGAVALLGDRAYQQVGLNELPAARGHTAVLAVGDDLTRPDHDLVIRALKVAELRFERVVVLPTAIDPDEHPVRAAMARTGAVVFAGDPRSFDAIASLCDARLAHHTACFADLEADGRRAGTLNAFRTDSEQSLVRPLPPGNVDISSTVWTFDAWLTTIADHELIRSDRPEVVIAATLLGRQVEYSDPGDGRLRALAEHWLAGLPVSELPRAEDAPLAPALPAEVREAVARLSRTLRRGAGRPAPTPPPRATVAFVTRNRPRLLAQALASLERAGTPHDVLVIDNHSSPPAAAAIEVMCRDRPRVRLVRLAENRRTAGGRNVAAELVETEHLMFLDDDAELLPNALAHLAVELERHPEAGAVTATVVSADGTVQHSGGYLRRTPETVETPLLGTFARIAQDPLPPSGPAGWAPGTAVLARTQLLREVPLDTGMNAYFEDNEWCYRVSLERPETTFRRSREAVVVHHSGFKPVTQRSFAGRSFAVEWLTALAHFYRNHDRLLAPWLLGVVPMLMRRDGSVDFAGARLLMELVLRKGTDWTLAAWMNGGLRGLLRANGYG